MYGELMSPRETPATDSVDPTLGQRVDRWLNVFKSSNRQKKLHSLHPPFPPEIWGLIIHHACLLYHDPLDTSKDLSFFDLHSPSLDHNTYRNAMRLKTNIACVSKQWNALSRIRLYEFVWIGNAAQAKALARTLLMEFVDKKAIQGEGSKGRISSGSYVRRLHIETPILERCSPADIRTILDFTPSLQIYSDHHSLQRSMFNDSPDPRAAPAKLLKLIAHPKLQRLSWTTYGSIPFSECISPLIHSHHGTLNLEYLELTCWSPDSRSDNLESFGGPASWSSRPSQSPSVLSLPSLRALKVSLDDNTFETLASWDMPLLCNLSVLSSDFRHTGPGFHAFLTAHGDKLVQLELGHSSSAIGEYYLTEPHHPQQANTTPATPISLATLCPNLKQVICSADAEWHWENPDWISPHILLPFHPNVELIGIRDIDKRLSEDPDYEHVGVTPYFPLFEQLVSLLRRDAFPSLRFVRDLSVESHELRLRVAQAVANPLPSTVPDRSSPNPKRVLQFWTRVVEKCRERGVWCEDYTGVNLTSRSLLRAGLMTTEREEKFKVERKVNRQKSKKGKRFKLSLLGCAEL